VRLLFILGRAVDLSWLNCWLSSARCYSIITLHYITLHIT